MNWLIRLVLLILILVSGTVAALAVGEVRGLALTAMSKAPVGDIVQAADSNTLFVTLGNEKQTIFRSHNGGYSWEQLNPGFPGPIKTLANHPLYPDILFAGTVTSLDRQGGNLWYSSDGGQTWDARLFGLPLDSGGQSAQITALTPSISQPNFMFMGTWGQGLYRFDIREGRMEPVGGQSGANLFVNDVVSSAGSPAYAVTTEGLMRINGMQLEKLSTPDGVVSLAVDPSDPQILYIGTVGYGVHRSTDAGNSWQPLNNGLGLRPGVILRVPAIGLDHNNPRHLAVTTAFGVGSMLVGDGLFESHDGGQSWTRVADLNNEIIDKLTIDSRGIYLATSNGLVRYGDPVPTPVSGAWQRIQTLASPTGVQLGILAITLLFGIWALFVRLSWSVREHNL
jgi:photosystem II stability/assembly factor-like uncharacterized protein